MHVNLFSKVQVQTHKFKKKIFEWQHGK